MKPTRFPTFHVAMRLLQVVRRAFLSSRLTAVSTLRRSNHPAVGSRGDRCSEAPPGLKNGPET